MNKSISIRLAAGALLCLATASAAFANGATDPDLTERTQNPFFISFGSFADGAELGTLLGSATDLSHTCPGSDQFIQDVSVLQALGLEMAVGVEAPLGVASIRFSDRFQTFGITNNQSLGRPHSVVGADALFRYQTVYFGPGIGIGYGSARSGLTFQGAPVQVLSAVVGCDVSQSAFAEARVQTAAAEAYRVASLSVGLRF
jgi:hypothetical protein